MADVKDILGVPRAGLVKQEGKKEKEKMQRPAGMSREAFALLDGSHPVVPTLTDGKKKGDLQGLKEKRKNPQKGTIAWEWRGFVNQGRSDALQLHHWAKCLKDLAGNVKLADEGDYRYAKYNKKMLIHRYNSEEWDNVIAKDPDWSREETDYLLDLCDQFCLKFYVIADRYEYAGKQDRSVEDLKGRYYSIARQLMISREGNQEDIENYTLIKAPYDANHERERKKALLMMMRRTPQQAAEEDEILAKAKVIEAARKAEEAAARGPSVPGETPPPAEGPAEAAAPPEFLDSTEAGVPSLLGPDTQPMRPAKPGVYCRRAHTDEQAKAQLSMVSGGARGVKNFENTLVDLNVADAPKIGTRSVCSTWLALRLEIIQMLELKQKVVKRQGPNTPATSADNRKKPSKQKGPRHDDDLDMPKEKRPRTARRYSDD